MKRSAKHLLLVDDNVTSRKLLVAMLESEGFITSEASNGVEALEVLNNTPVHAVISDILMPVMDGYTLCYQIRASNEHSALPFIFLTATYLSPSDEKDALAIGADKILRIPVDASETIGALTEIFSNPLYQKPRDIIPIKEIQVVRQYANGLLVKLEQKVLELQRQTEDLKKLSSALDQIADSVVITNKEGVIEYVNPAFEQTTGYTKGFAIGKTPSILKSGKQPRTFYEHLWKTILSGRTFDGELINKKQNGELFFEQQLISPVFDTNGQVAHFISAGRDVTWKRQAEEQLRSANAQMKELLDYTPAVIFKLKIEQGRVLPYMVSENIFHMLGFTVEESGSFEWWSTHLHPDDKVSAYASIEDTLRREKLTCEYRLRHKNGEYVWVEDNRRVLRDAAGRSLEIIGVWTDITARKHAEAATTQLAAIVQSSDDAIISKDLNGIITTWNKGAENIFGYSAGEMVGTSITRLIPTDRQIEENHILEKIEHSEKVEHFETVRQTRDGRLIDVSITESPIKDAAGTVVGASKIVRDITTRKRAEEQIRKLNRVYAVLSNINQAIVRIHDPQHLFNEACRIAVEDGHFHMAWIGTFNPEMRRVDIIASAGTVNDYLSKIDIDLNNEKQSQGPTGRAILTTTHVISNDIENDAAMRPWRDDLRALGIRSSVAFPLVVFGKVWGAFNLYSSEAGFFDADEIKLLDELAMDISFAIEFIQQETNRNRAEENLRESEKFLRESQLVARLGSYVLDIPTGIWKSSAVLDKILGIDDSFTRSVEGWISLIHPDWRDVIQNYFRDEVIAKQIRFDKEYKIIRKKDREERWVHGIGELEFDAEHNPIKMNGSVRDITEGKLAIEALVESEKKYRTIFEESTEGLFISTAAGKFLDANPALVKMMGYDSKEEVLALDVTKDIYANESDRERLLTMLESEGFVENFETIEKKKDGQKINVLLNVTAVRDKKGNITIIRGLTRDITKQRQLEQQFLRAQRMESIGTLAGGIAHDLNNVLAPIVMGIEVLKSKVGDEAGQRILRTLEISAQRGTGMVKQVLAFARGISGDRIVLQLEHLIREMEKIVRGTFPKSIEFSTKVDRNLWSVSADATQIHQVLLNLCVNARDAMPEGGFLTITAENTVTDRNFVLMNVGAKAGPYVVLSVTDTGTGIPQDLLDKVFDPFFTTKEIGKGTGLGLSTVHGIVTSHGGFIRVSSEMGRGTKFSVYLPAETSAEKTLEVKQVETPMGQGELILVVDDETPIRDICKATLESYGYSVLTASDGTEAVSLYIQRMTEIHLVITDMMMPYMGGQATIGALHKINPEVKIIATSGLMGQEKSIDVNDLPVYAFLAKPYTASKLLIAVSQALAPGKKL